MQKLIHFENKDRSMDGCVLFQFAANGGSYGQNFQIHKHDGWPDLYKACDLRKHCKKEKPEIANSEDETIKTKSLEKEFSGKVDTESKISDKKNQILSAIIEKRTESFKGLSAKIIIYLVKTIDHSFIGVNETGNNTNSSVFRGNNSSTSMEHKPNIVSTQLEIVSGKNSTEGKESEKKTENLAETSTKSAVDLSKVGRIRLITEL